MEYIKYVWYKILIFLGIKKPIITNKQQPQEIVKEEFPICVKEVSPKKKSIIVYKLTCDMVKEAREFRENGMHYKDIAIKYNVSASTISRAIKGITHKMCK